MWDFSGTAYEAKLSKYYLLCTLAFCFETAFHLCSLAFFLVPVSVLPMRANTFSGPARHTFLTLEPVKPFIQFSRHLWSAYESGAVLRPTCVFAFP